MQRIKSQQELDKIHHSRLGYIYNDYSGKGASGNRYNVLHRADCRWIKNTKISVPKYFFDTVDEADAWLVQNRGQEGVGWKQCGTCRPGNKSSAAVGYTKSKPEIDAPDKHTAPFTESEVEALLVRWLQKQGYDVETQVAVSSGIIDILVHGKKADWIIEVKGEDRGGYSSAQMNFQQGIGQLTSRMDDLEKRYVLAFPLTPDFLSVVKNYQGTIGLVDLGIYLIVINREGTVKRFEGVWIDELIDYMMNAYR